MPLVAPSKLQFIVLTLINQVKHRGSFWKDDSRGFYAEIL